MALCHYVISQGTTGALVGFSVASGALDEVEVLC